MHAETEAAKDNTTAPALPVPRIHKSNYRRAATIIRNAVRAWCLDHPGYSLSKQRPGSRGESSDAKRYYVERDAAVFRRGPKGSCLVSAVPNAFERHQGTEFAKVILEKFKK